MGQLTRDITDTESPSEDVGEDQVRKTGQRASTLEESNRTLSLFFDLFSLEFAEGCSCFLLSQEHQTAVNTGQVWDQALQDFH